MALLSFEPAARMAALTPYFFYTLNQKITQLTVAGLDVIRMDAGSPDLPPADFIVAALHQSAARPTHHGYTPSGGSRAYRAAWAQFYRRRFAVELDPETEVVGLLGSKEGVFNLALALVNPGDVVLAPDPGYAPYTRGAQFAGGEVVYMPLLARNQFLPDWQALTPAILRRTKIMWLNYPNNPTGATATLECWAQAIELARRYGFLIAHDAPYTEIAYGDYRPPSILELPGAREVCVEFHSVSKTYNMAGWRLAVMAGNARVVNWLGMLKSNIDSGLFQGLLDAAVVALTGDQQWLVARNAIYCQRRDLIMASLGEAGLEAVCPRAAIYVWARLPSNLDEQQYAADLLEATGVSLTPGTVFGPSGKGYVRLTLAAPTERIQEAMQRWVAWSRRSYG